MWSELEEDTQLQLSQQEIERKKGKFKHESKCGSQYIVRAPELKMCSIKHKTRSIRMSVTHSITATAYGVPPVCLTKLVTSHPLT